MIRQFVADNRAQNGADKAVNVVVSILVASLMAAYLLPMAINEIANVDTSSWTAGAAELWQLIPVMIVLSIFLFFTWMAVQRAGGN
jgi:hypothetical protein